MNTVVGELPTPPPFDFQKSLLFFRDFTPIRGEQVIGDSSIFKAVSIEGNAVAFRIRDAGSVESPRVSFTAYSEKEIPVEMLSDRLRFFLSLDDDLRGFYDLAEKDDVFQKVLQRFYGHKQVKFLTPFENACWAILTQRQPMAVAHKVKLAIVDEFGGKINLDGESLKSFPEAQALAAAERKDLVRLVKNERKCDYLISASSAFSKVDEKWLRSGPYEDVYNWLRSVKGIGEWSANFVMIRGLGRMELLSYVEDSLVGAASRVYGDAGNQLDESKVMELAQKYGRYQGYWAYYIRIFSEFSESGRRMNME